MPKPVKKKKKRSGIIWLKKRLKGKRARQLIRFINTRAFAKLYVLFSLSVLLVTTLFWSILGARLQSGNADQLVNPYLFEHSTTFRDALLPGAHTFLIKWPLFLLVKIFGSGNSAFAFFTVAVVLLTVAALAAIIYRIERRPLVFGTLCLALASTLLLVPAMPVAGAILPVNMAMLATRNLEYVLYIASLILLIRSPRVRSRDFWLAIVLLSLLMASDRLFFDLSLGGALLALVVYALRKGWNLVSLSVNWVLGSVVSAIAAIGILWVISSHGITHIVGLSGAGPYGLVHNLHDLLLGILYGLLGIATNFGANPAFDNPIVRDIPHNALSRLSGVSGLSFLVNLGILLLGVFAAWQLIRLSLAHNKDKEVKLDSSARLSITLVWTALATFLIFIFSSHYYAVDARYLTICLFALFIALTVYGRGRRRWSTKIVVMAGLVILISIILGSITTLRTYNGDKAALAPVVARDNLVLAALKQHPAKTLVGDYWRVLPIKQSSGKNKINVMPLSGCFQPRDTLSSKAWQTDLQKNSFAYLLSLDRSLTDYPRCTLDQVIAQYGRPNSSVLIAGSLSKPNELLLFYDRGAHKSAPKVSLKTPSTILPIGLDELPYTTCPVPSVMNIVAHQDDDLLFMSPDLLHDVQAGHCTRTVYITAGDAGSGQFYWLSRQQGSEAAYSKMLGSDDIWIDRIVKLNDREYITVSNPRGNSRISLIFIHLPDGNIKGQGFAADHFESLARLESGQTPIANAVDGQSTYSSDQLVAALSALMHTFQPAEIRTQANYTGRRIPDHSDHMAVGRYVKKAYQQYEDQQFEDKIMIPLKFYIGYPIHDMPANVSGDDLAQKMAAFFAYGQFDGGVCHSAHECAFNPAYGAYLPRQYQNSY
jgi:LmbE family N-acetylglucosaminyl deacetylase